MPSFRVILIRMFPRLGTSIQNTTVNGTTTGNHFGSRTQTGQALKNGDVKTGILCSRNYGVEYTTKPTDDESSFVHLVEIDVAREVD
jgi:hypothetical protein